MAFTLAHMAAALPFYRNNNKSHSRRWLQFDALLIGTMIPDLPYYTGGNSAIGDLSHQWVGVLTYCLPSGILVFALWYWVLKPAAYGLIKPFLRKATGDRFNEDRYKGQRRIIGYADKHWSFARLKKRIMHGLSSFYLPVIFGLIFGAATHLVWDGFTHADGSIARHIDWLQYPLYFYPFKGTSIARLLQYLTSMAGLAALLWFAISRLQARQRQNYKSKTQIITLDDAKSSIFTKRQSLSIVGLMLIASLALVMQAVLKWYPSLIGSPYRFAAKVSVSVLPDIALLCLVYALVYQFIYLSRHVYFRDKKR